MTVGGVMTSDVQVATPEEDVRALVRRMRIAGVRSVPVVQRGAVVGVVTLRDLVALVAREDDRIAADVRRALDCYADGHYRVGVRDGVAVIVDEGDSRAEWHTVRVLAEQVAGIQHARVMPAVCDREDRAVEPDAVDAVPVDAVPVDAVPVAAEPDEERAGTVPEWTPSTRWWAG
jgi:CBS domain-containing protein